MYKHLFPFGHLSLLFVIIYCSFMHSCMAKHEESFNTNNFAAKEEIPYVPIKIIPAAERVALYVPKLKNKSVGLVINQTSRVEDQHIIDSLLKLDVNVRAVFTPEHGFTGSADAGEKVEDGFYKGIPLISLYGKHKKPTPEDLEGLDVLLFDIQDVGVRFYTYISTLHLVMEAAAENNVGLIVLDRPNPNGHYVDGPILEKEFTSFVGMHPVPVVYGMTIGEYATMINGEAWLENGIQAELEVIPCIHYDHSMTYDLPIKPSPNLPNLRSILLYPSLCFFEGTNVSIGRGTQKQFQIIGHPAIKDAPFQFTPKSSPGAKYPKHENQLCKGEDLTQFSADWVKNTGKLNLTWLIQYYQMVTESNEPFFLESNFFEKLAGTASLRKSIVSGESEDQIRESWKDGLKKFKSIRAKYLLYEDFH